MFSPQRNCSSISFRLVCTKFNGNPNNSLVVTRGIVRGPPKSVGFIVCRPWKYHGNKFNRSWVISVWTHWLTNWWTDWRGLKPKKCKNKVRWVKILADFRHWECHTAREMPLHRHNVWHAPFYKANGLTTEPNFFTSHMQRACMHVHMWTCV